MFTFKTNLDAPNYKMINIDLTKPEQVSSFCNCFPPIAIVSLSLRCLIFYASEELYKALNMLQNLMLK